jgi:hypothetical protein
MGQCMPTPAISIDKTITKLDAAYEETITARDAILDRINENLKQHDAKRAHLVTLSKSSTQTQTQIEAYRMVSKDIENLRLVRANDIVALNNKKQLAVKLQQASNNLKDAPSKKITSVLKHINGARDKIDDTKDLEQKAFDVLAEVTTEDLPYDVSSSTTTEKTDDDIKKEMEALATSTTSLAVNEIDLSLLAALPPPPKKKKKKTTGAPPTETMQLENEEEPKKKKSSNSNNKKNGKYRAVAE